MYYIWSYHVQHRYRIKEAQHKAYFHETEVTSICLSIDPPAAGQRWPLILFLSIGSSDYGDRVE